MSRGRLEVFWGSRMKMAAALCRWASRYFSVVRSETFMTTQRLVSTGSSEDRASATTMAPRQPGREDVLKYMTRQWYDFLFHYILA